MNKGKEGTICGCLFGMQRITNGAQLITDNMPLYAFFLNIVREEARYPFHSLWGKKLV
jgi:hypothetical protein